MDIHDRARVLANKSKMAQKHSCLILRKGKIVSEGYNYPIESFCHKFSLHAEIVAVGVDGIVRATDKSPPDTTG